MSFAEVVDPLLHYKKQNEIIAMGAERYTRTLQLLFKNVFQGGFMSGQEPETNPWVKMIGLVLAHDYYRSVIDDPDSLPGDAERAQDGLFEEEKLKQELLFSDAQTNA